MMNEKISKNEQTAFLSALRDVHVMYVKQQLTLLSALQNKFGPEVAQVVEQENCALVCRTYLAGSTGTGSIEALINLLWEPLRTKGYEFSVTHSEDGVQMKCTACPWARLYRNLGGADWGYRLYCAVDEDLVKGFNSQIGFKRTKTLMEGDEYCDHFYYMKE
ncbi:MAG: hypothetical protein CVU39_14060 [Chloroflexi bacterium HGW-Chloroflexi-10]|nr:MAG: hypothetical protein CVU39_14060 [Chloroflexi bacterium HGW-Chloroflexi-10]